MGHVQKSDAAQRADQKYHVEPPVIEVKLQVAEHLRYDHPTMTYRLRYQYGTTDDTYKIIHILCLDFCLTNLVHGHY